ncbi:hypothetical protein GME_12693 [Halomonas sp. TD01]|nr:hypothetical protein GME_12693 [Halomonas sp. TD01]
MQQRQGRAQWPLRLTCDEESELSNAYKFLYVSSGQLRGLIFIGKKY